MKLNGFGFVFGLIITIRLGWISKLYYLRDFNLGSDLVLVYLLYPQVGTDYGYDLFLSLCFGFYLASNPNLNP